MKPLVSGPTVSVIVSTRNRPAHIAECVKTILRNDGFLELLVIDQSDGKETAEALSSVTDPRVRYVRSDTRGVTLGRNLGMELSRGDIIAFTDDDCRVPEDWVRKIAHLFMTDPDAALVCGRVRVPDGERGGGYGAEFEPEVREWRGRYPPPDRDWGITANWALRRELLNRVGAFDPILGAGAPLRSGGEPDYLFRTIKAGFKVVNAAEIELIHLGVRTAGAESTRLWSAYGAGTAAALFKHVRLGDLSAARIYASHLGKMARVITLNLVRGHRPTGVGYTLAFLSGTLNSCRHSIDRERRVYLPKR